MIKLMTTAAVAVALAAPALAQGTRQGDAQQQPREMSEQGRECMNDLQQLDQRLAELGYGRAGPGGYGAYGAPYGGAGAPPATQTETGALAPAHTSSPRADMYTLMRAGYLMALHGYDDGCAQVVAAAEDMGSRYEEAIRTGDPAEARQWRGDYLASAVSVTELDRPMRTDDIIGADVRNMQDEDLGDVDDVVLGPDGSVQYVIVSTGGFLGIGSEEVAVRWQDLRITVEPYRDTFILDVPEDVFENAPRLKGDARAGLTEDQRANIDRYWEDAGVGSARR